MSKRFQHDVVIIGSGAAGLTLALQLADCCQIALLSKGALTETCTLYAQGGLAAVLNDEDSIESHIEDTLNAGAGLCDPATVRFAAENAKESVQWLIEKGVKFTQETQPNGQLDYHLTREGGHSHRRVIHAADATGHAIETTLVEQVQNHPNITCFEHYTAINLIMQQQRCVGLYALNNQKQQVDVFQGRFIVLATGGASKTYLYTSNPDTSCGDGIAMAWRVGCRVANLEFNQFHPTCLYHPQAKSFLITEAIRGEGGRLLLPDGTRFMPQFDARAELAPRDIVARAIDHEMKRLGIDYVYLNISHKSPQFIMTHFPNVYQRCLNFGFDLTKDRIPVVPAAHYTCGGVITDLHGRTDMAGLYAIGEVACTGLHGANRMASNSLLECLVFAKAASIDIKNQLHQINFPKPAPLWDESQVIDSDEEVVVSHNWDEVRRLMWDYVGIVRTNKRLERAHNRIVLLKQEINDYYNHFKVSKNLIELRNLVVVADLIIRCARMRKESRGLHYNLDYLQCENQQQAENTILTPTTISPCVSAKIANVLSSV